MQTTLLGLAIAFILALIAALIGPLFIDWNQYRPQFEAEAARIIGAPVRVEGSLDARLLPAPILRLRKLAIGKPGDASKMTAENLDVEFSLGSLLRGEWRASELTLGGLALDIGLDKQGRIDWPAAKGSFNLRALAIDHLNLSGRVDLRDAASGGHLILDDLVFSGDVRALATTMRGEGHFKLAGAQTPFRVSTGQTADNPGMRLKLSLDPGERPFAVDVDGVLTFADESPRFDGALTVTRGTETPWRISTKLKASPASAAFEDMEWAYGAEDVALKLNGRADMQFGASPRLQLKLSAPQLDADRLLAKSEHVSPLALARNLRDLVVAIPAAPVPVQIDITVDQIALGSRPIQNFAAGLRSDNDGWAIERLDLSAPGYTDVNLRGEVKRVDDGSRFDGFLAVDSKSSRSFQDWLLGKPLASYHYETPLVISAMAGIGKNGTDLSNLKMTIDGNSLEGRITQTRDEVAAVLQSLSFDFASFGDIDGALMRLKAAGLPRARVSVDIAQATIAGQNAGPVAAEIGYRADAQTETAGTVFNLVVSRADLVPWLGMPLGVSDLKASVTVSGERFSFSNIDGTLGETHLKGNIAATRADPPNIDGDVALDSIDIAPLVSSVLGGSGRAGTDPLGRGLLQGWRGRLAFKAARANLPGGMTLSDLGGVLLRDERSFYIDDLKAGLGGGTASAKLRAMRSDSGTSVNAQIQITDCDGDALRYRSLVLPEGKASLQMTLSSEGRSLTALGNALSGNGVLTLDGVRIEGLDTGAFDAAVNASDNGQTMDDIKLKAIVDPVLAQGAVAVNAAQIPFDIKDGRLRVNSTTLEGGNARVTVSGGYDMPAGQADLRATLTSPLLGTPASHPDLQIYLHGTPDALDRSLDVSGLSSWLAMRAIERETKRLDQLEGKGVPSSTGDHQPHSDAQPSAPAPDAKQSGRAAPVPDPQRGIRADSQTAAPLPPPIDIRPAPAMHPKKQRPSEPRGLPPVGSAF